MRNFSGFSFDQNYLIDRVNSDDRVLVLGGMDTGKTTLVRCLQNHLGGEVLDADLGQPEIGPPGLISAGTYQNGMEEAYFVGSFTPRGKLVQVMTGIARLAKRRFRFVDTDGWVKGPAAQTYKGELINLIEPDLLVLLQETDELEPLSTHLSEENVLSVEPQQEGVKTRGERTSNRMRAFKFHFSRSKRIEKFWDEIQISGTLIGKGKEVASGRLVSFFPQKLLKAWKYETTLTFLSRTRPTNPEGLKEKTGVQTLNYFSTEKLNFRLVGCFVGTRFQSLGTITQLGEKGLTILTPSEKFSQLRLGEERVKPTGRTIC